LSSVWSISGGRSCPKTTASVWIPALHSFHLVSSAQSAANDQAQPVPRRGWHLKADALPHLWGNASVSRLRQHRPPDDILAGAEKPRGPSSWRKTSRMSPGQSCTGSGEMQRNYEGSGTAGSRGARPCLLGDRR
jgi:hypothetical protein